MDTAQPAGPIVTERAKAAVTELPPPPPGSGGWPWARRLEPGIQPADPRDRWPRISIVTPSFNQGRFLEQALRSVLLQEYPNLEYIVMDGGSSDNSLDILERYGSHLAYWQSRADAGQADAIGSGFARATGEIHGYLNSDDILLPGALRHVARMFLRRPATGVVYGNRLVIDNEGKVIGRHIWPYYLSRYHWARGQPLAQECCFWREAVYRRVGGIDRKKVFIMDYDLFYRMWMVTRYRKTRAYLGAFRVHSESKTATQEGVRQREMAAAMAQYALREPGYFRTRLMNRSDRMQVLFDHVAERVFGDKIAGIE